MRAAASTGVRNASGSIRSCLAVPGVFQGLFFTPASVVKRDGVICYKTRTTCALAAQALPGIAGMQLRNYCCWVGLDDDGPAPDGSVGGRHLGQLPRTSGRCHSMPHGGGAAARGGRAWLRHRTVSGGGRVASVLCAILMTGCHLLILPLYVTYVLRWAGRPTAAPPASWWPWHRGTAPLMWTRTTFMLGELRRGVASGGRGGLEGTGWLSRFVARG